LNVGLITLSDKKENSGVQNPLKKNGAEPKSLMSREEIAFL